MRETSLPTPSGTTTQRWKGFSFVLGALLIAVGCAGTSAPTPSSSPTSTPTPSPTHTPSTTTAPSPSSAPAFPVTLVDDEGTEVTLASRPERIVSLTPAVTETLFAIGAGDRVVAKVEDIANYPPEAASVPIVGTFAGVDVEKIIDLTPDLVIVGGQGGTPPDTIDQMRRLDLAVLVVYASDIEAVLSDIELIGDAGGTGEAARDLTASMRAAFDQTASATRDVPRPRVFYETGDTPAIYGVADDSFIAAMLELAGSDPITTGSPTNWEMSTEALIQADPEVIILGDSAYGVTEEVVAARPGWGVITAVRQGRIYSIDDIIVTRPGPRLAEGLRALVDAIHPQLALPQSPAAATASP